MFRENTKFLKYIEPKVCSFGPIHHGRDKLLPGEKIKRTLASRLIREYLIDEIKAYLEIENQIHIYRCCYHEMDVDKYTNEELILMFLMDGCALLSYIVSFVSGGLYNMRKENIPVDSVLSDVFSTENQLPYVVLEHIINNNDRTKKIESSVDDFVRRHCMATDLKITGTITGNWRPSHLLELLWKQLRYPAGGFPELYALDESMADWSPSHSVKELKAVRIHLKPSPLSMLRDIAFKEHWFPGELHMRSLIVDDTTASILSNLVAYEICPDFQNDLEVTSYLCFLNSLIVNVEDVAELRSAQVLISCLPSDQDVFNLIRETASKLTPNPFIYHDVKQRIQSYLNRERRITVATWLGAAAQVYFQSPWTTIATLAANFAIILTLVQTYYAIFPRQK